MLEDFLTGFESNFKMSEKKEKEKKTSLISSNCLNEKNKKKSKSGVVLKEQAQS